MKRSRLVEAVASVTVGYSVAVTTQLVVFRDRHATTPIQIDTRLLTQARCRLGSGLTFHALIHLEGERRLARGPTGVQDQLPHC